MPHRVLTGIAIVFIAVNVSLRAQDQGKSVVTMKTSKGTIEIELYPDKAPKTVANFLQYVDDHFFDGLVFHRVIPQFMIQGGGMDANLKRKQTRDPIKNEADNGLKNDLGTIAMARTGVIDSATSQFFINVNRRNNDFLNHTSKNQKGYGYCVFGKVTDGMDVAYAIEKVKTQTVGASQNVPVQAVIIESVRRRGGGAAKPESSGGKSEGSAKKPEGAAKESGGSGTR